MILDAIFCSTKWLSVLHLNKAWLTQNQQQQTLIATSLLQKLSHQTNLASSSIMSFHQDTQNSLIP